MLSWALRWSALSRIFFGGTKSKSSAKLERFGRRTGE